MLEKQKVVEDLKEIHYLISESEKDMVGNFFHQKKIKFKFIEFFNLLIHSKKYDANLEEIKSEQ